MAATRPMAQSDGGVDSGGPVDDRAGALSQRRKGMAAPPAGRQRARRVGDGRRVGGVGWLPWRGGDSRGTSGRQWRRRQRTSGVALAQAGVDGNRSVDDVDDDGAAVVEAGGMPMWSRGGDEGFERRAGGTAATRIKGVHPAT